MAFDPARYPAAPDVPLVARGTGWPTSDPLFKTSYHIHARTAPAPPICGKHLTGEVYTHDLAENSALPLNIGNQHPMRIATWNVNSIRQRMENLRAWLQERQPDVVCLQETKITDDAFPRSEIEDLGYNLAVHGQKTFNGVALLSKYPFETVTNGLPGDPTDDHARFIEAVVSHPAGTVRVASIYLPNGNPVASDKYPYKMNWMDRLYHYVSERLKLEEDLVLAGDYNVIPAPDDVHDPAAWAEDALFRPPTREKFRALTHLGLTDAIRAASDAKGLYTFWDYQAGAWQKNNGIRIDHLLLSPRAADRLSAAGIDKYVRNWEKPSDHVPVWIDLDIVTR